MKTEEKDLWTEKREQLLKSNAEENDRFFQWSLSLTTHRHLCTQKMPFFV